MPPVPFAALGFAAGLALRAVLAALPLAALACVAAATVIAGCRGRLSRSALFLAMFVGGIATGLCHPKLRAPAPPPGTGVDDAREDVFRGTVTGPIVSVPSGERFVVEVGSGARVLVAIRGSDLLPGDRVLVRGKLRATDYLVPGAPLPQVRRWMRGVDYRVRARSVEWISAGRSLWRLPTIWHRRLSREAKRLAGEDEAGAFLRAAVLGDRSGLTPRLGEQFRRTGTSHVLAVSGLHLAVVCSCVFWVFARAWGWAMPGSVVSPRRAAALAAMVAAVGFALVTGGRPSTVRAAGIALVWIFGLLVDRRPRLMHSLSIVALAMLLYDPRHLWQPSFQLSVVAVAALALLPARAAPATRRDRWLARPMSLVAATCAASMATAPIVAHHFGEIATLGAVANLLVVPMVELCVVPLGGLGVALVPLAPAVAEPVLSLAALVARGVVEVTGAIASAAPMWRPRPGASWALLPLLVALLGGWRGTGLRFWHRAAFACASVLWLAYAVLSRPAHGAGGELRIAFLDVGQGDASVIEFPNGDCWLVDVGGVVRPDQDGRPSYGPAGRSLEQYLRARSIERIDRVVLTHPHPDHFGGLPALLRTTEVGAIVWAPAPAGELPGFPKQLDALITLVGVRADRPALGTESVGAASVTWLWPRYDLLPGRAASDPVLSANDNSIVMAVEFAGRRVLFAGDIEEEAEELLVGAGAGLRADLVKVPHHGSRTSSTLPFLSATEATIAVISVGRGNRHRLPNSEVVARWSERARVYRTDRSGSIVIEIGSDGTVSVAPFLREPYSH